ncbi:hypothetical protein HY250_04800 [Candidatus Azambacteria bacterium]|nr:hypothetical protein [Candidatus Azambacteria bacterium]MBI3685697.1 hypothetical protein [Candidatus Azambacteria bacterium]
MSNESAKKSDLSITSLAESLVKAHFLDGVNKRITDKLFPVPDRIGNDYMVYGFRGSFLFEEVIRQIRAEGHEPANSHELALWRDWDRSGIVVALGSIVYIDEEHEGYTYGKTDKGAVCYVFNQYIHDVPHALMLISEHDDAARNDQYLSITSLREPLTDYCRFLAVRKPSGL